MRKPLLGLVILFLAPALASGQTGGERRAWASLTAGVGRDVNSFFSNPPVFRLVRGSVGTGFRWVGIRTNLAYVREGRANVGDWGVEGLVRLRPLRPDTRGLVPYVFAGPGFFFGFTGGGIEPKFNFGGGVDYFRSPRWGLRFEVHDSVVSEATIHHLDFSGGIVFRF